MTGVRISLSATCCAVTTAAPSTTPALTTTVSLYRQGIQFRDGYCPPNSTITTTAACETLCLATTSLPTTGSPGALCVAGQACTTFTFSATFGCFLGDLGATQCN